MSKTPNHPQDDLPDDLPLEGALPDQAKSDEPKGPPKPEQIWPPPEEPAEAAPMESADDTPEAVSSDEELIELDWSDQVGKIDETIQEIRRINGGAAEEFEDIPMAVEEPADLEPDDLVEPMEEPEPTRPEVAPTAITSAKFMLQPKSEGEIAQLWGNIFLGAAPASPKIIVVTSARKGDGATQIATSLALIGAEGNSELNVCLVDFNLRSPQIAGLLGLRSEPGLSDVLDGKTNLNAAIQLVQLSGRAKLAVLAAGAPADHPLGLLKSRQVQGLLRQLAQRFDHVILDVANAKTYADAQVLGSLADGAVLVAMAGETPRETVADAKRRLDLAGVRCLGVVLNQRRDPIPSLLYRVA